MKKMKIPVRFFIEPRNAFTNEVISGNSNGLAWETEIKYKKTPLKVWGTDKLSFIRFIEKSRVTFPELDFQIYAEVNNIVQKWQLYKYIGKMTKPVKAAKELKNLAAKK